MNRLHNLLLPLALAIGLFRGSAAAADHQTLVCVGGKVYPSPTAAPLENSLVLIQDGKIGADIWLFAGAALVLASALPRDPDRVEKT